MLNFVTKTICLTDITKQGVACDCPRIKLNPIQGVAQNCVVANGCFDVQVPEDISPNTCIEGYIICEDCGKCPAKYFKICLCDDNLDCPACHTCVNGLCVAYCTDSQYCLEGQCVECEEECPNGKVCLNGKCQCPSDKPFEDAHGNCVSCLTSENCPACTECIGGKCLPIACDKGVCNPETGICQDCINSGHCADRTDGRNCCNEDGKCDCCDGYYFDVVQGKCIQNPQCTKDTDCPPCSICVDGLCVPIECPDGYICDPDTGDCVFNPCPNQPCNNGAECGPDCGCFEGQCVPCRNLQCNTDECAKALGCECYGTVCAPTSGCSGNCSTGYDCGQGCTCYQGQCVPCSNFPCIPDECSSRPGCQCNGQNCAGTGKTGCTDTFELIKIDEGCDLEARLNVKKNCPCPSITVGITPSSISQTNDYKTSVQISLHKGKGLFTTLPKLGDVNNANIAENERPRIGTICMDLVVEYDEFDSNNVKIATRTTLIPVGGNMSFANADTVNSAEFLIPKIGSTLSQNQIVSSVKLRIKQCGIFDFPNSCTYSENVGETLYQYNVASDNWNAQAQGEINTDDKRYPRFTWYRSEDNVFTSDEIIRDLYIEPSSTGIYIDTLYGPNLWNPIDKQNLNSPEGLLIPNRFYQVVNDCSCSPVVSSEKIFFCESDIINLPEPTLLQCGRRLVLNGDPKVCDVNKDLTAFTDINGSNYTGGSSQWTLYVNGDAVETFTFNNAANELRTPEGLEFESYTYNHDENITNVVIEQDGSKCRTEFNFDSSDIIPAVSTSCVLGKIEAKFVVEGYIGGVTLESVVINGYANSYDGTYFVFSQMESDVEYTYTANFSNGCTYTGTFIDTCCQKDLVETQINCNSDGTFDLIVLPNINGLEITLTDQFGTIYPLSGLTSGVSYTLTAKLNDNCITTKSITTDCCTAGSIRIDSIDPSPFCNSGELVIVKVSGTPGVTFSLGLVTVTSQPVVGNVEVCSPFATDQVIPSHGFVQVPYGLFSEDSFVNQAGTPQDITVAICSVSNPGADCEVEVEVERMNAVVYPDIDYGVFTPVCSEDNTEYSISFPTTRVVTATTNVGNLTFNNNLVNVTNIPNGETVTIELGGENGICTRTFETTITCNAALPPAPEMVGPNVFCEGDTIGTQTANNIIVGYELQVSTDQVNWTALGGATYVPPSAGTYYFRYSESGVIGPVSSVTVGVYGGPSIGSTSVIENCTKIQLNLNANHAIGTNVQLYNAASCAGSPAASLVNPQISGNVVTYVVPAGVNLDSSSWSVKYGECSCAAIDTVTPGCGSDCDCVVELREDPSNDCELELEMNGSGCGTYNLIEIKDSSDTLVFTANNPTDNYLEHIGPNGDFSPLIPLVDQEEYTVTVSGPSCDSKQASHTLDCLSCDNCPTSLTVDIGVASGTTAPSWAGVFDLIWLTDMKVGVRECPGGSINTIPLWSGGGAGSSGKEEALVYIDATCSGSEQSLIDAHFGDSRTLVSYATMVANAEAELQTYYPDATITLDGTEVTIEGVPCLTTFAIVAFRRELTTGPCALSGSGTNPYGLSDWDYNCSCL